MRDFLKGLELDKETIDTIMAEHGKLVTADKEKISELESTTKELTGKVKTYEDKVVELEKVSGDSQKTIAELESLKKSIADNEAKAKAESEDNVLTNNIKSVFGEKKFINEYTENAIISDIKKALKETANVGKSAKDVFEAITKDKQGLFTNPNTVVDIEGAGEVDKNVSKEAHERELMGLPVETKK